MNHRKIAKGRTSRHPHIEREPSLLRWQTRLRSLIWRRFHNLPTKATYQDEGNAQGWGSGLGMGQKQVLLCAILSKLGGGRRDWLKQSSTRARGWWRRRHCINLGGNHLWAALTFSNTTWFPKQSSPLVRSSCYLTVDPWLFLSVQQYFAGITNLNSIPIWKGDFRPLESVIWLQLQAAGDLLKYL